jgi:opacity protein-like surface antigen
MVFWAVSARIIIKFFNIFPRGFAMTTSKRLAFLAFTASAIVSAAPAFADMESSATHRSIYFRGAIGLQQLQGMEYDINAGEVRTQYEKAPVYSGAIGYDFGNYTAEVELSSRSNDTDTQTLLGSKLPAASGTTESTALMVNAYYETPTDGQWQPYIGLGVGMAQVDLNTHQTAGILLLDDGEMVAAYQGMIGMQYNFTPQISAFAEYRYFATDTVAITTNTNTNHEVAYEVHNGLFGLKYAFQ